MARRPPTLVDLLGNPHARSVMQQLAEGVDPRLVAAKLAGDMLAKRMADGMGVRLPLPESIPAAPKKPTTAQKSSVSEGDIIDAEYTVIDVSPGVKRRMKKD